MNSKNELTVEGYMVSDKHQKILERAAMAGKQFMGFVLTCPAYQSEGEIYTFEALGEGVPMMTSQHLEAIAGLTQVLQAQRVEIGLVVLVADIEATNKALVDTYTAGDEAEYLRRCRASTEAIHEKYSTTFTRQGIGFEASSFLLFFEDDAEQNKFLSSRQRFVEILHERMQEDSRFSYRVTDQVASKLRNGYYQLEYRESRIPDFEVLREREVTTMAEYLALGELVRKSLDPDTQPFIVIHEGANAGLLNDLGKFDATHENSQAIPLIKRIKEVY